MDVVQGFDGGGADFFILRVEGDLPQVGNSDQVRRVDVELLRIFVDAAELVLLLVDGEEVAAEDVEPGLVEERAVGHL